MNTTHPDELLSWYVNGTLSGSELSDVKQHLDTCDRCRREVALLEKIRSRIREDRPRSPGDFALSRLLRDIQRQPAARRTGWWRPALAAAAVIILAQGALLMNLLMSPAPITPLGETPADAVLLQLRFAPDATEAQIRTLLQRTRASLEGGPGALGIYRVRLEGVSPADAEAVRRIVLELRAQDRIIAHVERE